MGGEQSGRRRNFPLSPSHCRSAKWLGARSILANQDDRGHNRLSITSPQRLLRECLLNGWQEIINDQVFGDEARRSKLEGTLSHFLINGSSKHNHNRLRHRLLDLTARLDTIKPWHRDVEHDDLRGQPSSSFKYCATRCHLPHDFT